jgi:multiple antibiotic resistance protein
MLVHTNGKPTVVSYPVSRAGRSPSMTDFQIILSNFVLLWAVIDPIGTIPVFIAATRGRTDADRRRVALRAAAVAAGILLFFIVVGEPILNAMGVPVLAFQIAGGIVLFLFALTMIFGESKPQAEEQDIHSAPDIAIFPLATPSIASPGAMMAVVLMTQNDVHTVDEQIVTAVLMLAVVGAAYLFMRCAGLIMRLIGEGGANVVSRVMGMILASVAATEVLEGIKHFFS